MNTIKWSAIKSFLQEKEKLPFYVTRHYARSTWAFSCAHDVRRAEGVLEANARVLKYVKDNDLWGGAPFAFVVHVSLESQDAWNANERLGSLEAGGAEDLLHKTVCAAYFLPRKYQASG